MKVALICPANISYMPYLNNYIKILDCLNIKYTIINWDRLNLEEDIEALTYRDEKLGHQRNFFDYLRYKKFVLDKLKETRYDKIVIFTLQLGYFLKKHLIHNYKEKYIFDIRDYNKIFKVSNFKKFIDYSYLTVLSSPGYKLWLPQSDKYIINHNTLAKSLNELKPFNNILKNDEVEILTIGLIRHWGVTSDFVNAMKNKDYLNLIFHGDGTINEKLKNYIIEQGINNVRIYGRYKKEDEGIIYEDADIVNTLMYSDHINCKTLLTNRIYNSVVYGKPMLALKGTYQTEQIEKHNLGLVLDSLEGMDIKIKEYIRSFDSGEYKSGRESFLNMVIKENIKFEEKLKKFIDK